MSRKLIMIFERNVSVARRAAEEASYDFSHHVDLSWRKVG